MADAERLVDALLEVIDVRRLVGRGSALFAAGMQVVVEGAEHAAGAGSFVMRMGQHGDPEIWLRVVDPDTGDPVAMHRAHPLLESTLTQLTLIQADRAIIGPP